MSDFLSLIVIIFVLVYIVVLAFCVFSRIRKGGDKKEQGSCALVQEEKGRYAFRLFPHSVVAPALPSISLIAEDDKVSPHDADLRPHKRNIVDVREDMPAGVDLSEDEFMVRENTMIYVEEDVGATSEVPQLEEINVAASSRPEVEMATEGVLGDSSVPREEASSFRMDMDAFSFEGTKERVPLTRAASLILTWTLRISRD